MQRQISSDSEASFHSLSDHAAGAGAEDGNSGAMEPPVHPVPAMQGAFEESIIESADIDDELQSTIERNAGKRRRDLLEAEQYDESWLARWKQRPGSRYHPLLKLMAQIVFGMHLLQQGQAKSDEEVVKILQTHVNEVDSFLERTAEDFDLAIKDIEERIRYLRLPMQHMDVFEIMLDEKKFRTDLLVGNDKIERIIDRTGKARNAALHDIKNGLRATQALGAYLSSIEDQWTSSRSGIAEIFSAMRGNELGWKKYLRDLQRKGTNLENHLVALGTIIGEISRLAAAASRRNKPQGRTVSPASFRSTPGLRSRFAHDPPASPTSQRHGTVKEKPLPREPGFTIGAGRTAVPKPHPIPFAQRFEDPRAAPSISGSSFAGELQSLRQRPSTSGTDRATRTRAANSDNTRELVAFLQDSRRSDLSEVSPFDPASRGTDKPFQERKATRSASQGARDVLNASNKESRAQVARSMSQGQITLVSHPQQRKESQRKPVGQSSLRSEAKLTKSPPSTAVDKESNHGDSFTRRFSRRLKNLAMPPDQEKAFGRSAEAASKNSMAHQRSLSSSQRLRNFAQPPVENPTPADNSYARQASHERGTVKQTPYSLTSRSQSPEKPAAALPSDSAYSSVIDKEQNRSRGPSDTSAETDKDNAKTDPENTAAVPVGAETIASQQAPSVPVLSAEKPEGSIRAEARKDSISLDSRKDLSPKLSTPVLSHPPSRLGLFPTSTTGAMTPSQASIRSRNFSDMPGSSMATLPAEQRSVTMPANMSSSHNYSKSTSSGRGLSFRRFFHMKRESQNRNVLPAGA